MVLRQPENPYRRRPPAPNGRRYRRRHGQKTGGQLQAACGLCAGTRRPKRHQRTQRADFSKTRRTIRHRPTIFSVNLRGLTQNSLSGSLKRHPAAYLAPFPYAPIGRLGCQTQHFPMPKICWIATQATTENQRQPENQKTGVYCCCGALALLPFSAARASPTALSWARTCSSSWV